MFVMVAEESEIGQKKNNNYTLYMHYEIGKKNHRYGLKLSDEEKLQRGAKTVIQYSENGIKINKYISIHEANNVTGISRDTISKCCKGIYKQAGGFIWKFDT